MLALDNHVATAVLGLVDTPRCSADTDTFSQYVKRSSVAAARSFPLPNRAMTIDGLANDWQGLAPLFVEIDDFDRPVDDASDLKAIYAAKDSVYLYLLAELSAPANRSNWLCLRVFDQSKAERFQLGVDINGIRYVWPWPTNPGLVASYRDVGEFAVPLQIASYPFVYVSVSVVSQRGTMLDLLWLIPVGISMTPGLVLEYLVSIKNPSSHLAEVKLNVSNIYVPVIVLKFVNNSWPTMNLDVSELVFMTDGLPANVNQLGSKTWEIVMGERKTIQVRYLAKAFQGWRSNDLVSYIGESFGLIWGWYFFISPDDTIGPITVSYVLPPSWKVVSSWREESGVFKVESKEELLDNFVGVGPQFITFRQQIRGVNVTVAVTGQTRVPPSQIAANTFAMYTYLTSFLDYWNIPYSYRRGTYTVFYPPPPIGMGQGQPSETIWTTSLVCNYSMGRLWIPEYNISVAPGWTTAAHEQFHSLCGFRGLWHGLAEYYGEKATISSGAEYPEVFHQLIATGTYDWPPFKQYQTAIASGADCPLTDQYNNDSPRCTSPSSWFYAKSILASYLLDETMKLMTDGLRSLNDAIRYLNANYFSYVTTNRRLNVPYPEWLTMENLLDAVNRSTGKDLSWFFSRYVYGTERLPLTVVDGRLSLEWSNLHVFVKDQNGKAVEGASVKSISQPPGQASLSGQTDANGKVKFNCILPGPYVIQTLKTGYLMAIKSGYVDTGQTVTETITLIQSSTEKGTSRIELDALPKPGQVNKPVTISGAMYGSWRYVRDGMVVGKPVEIATGWGFSTVLTTDYFGKFSVATNCPSTGGTYPIIATFYEDQDLLGNSTTIQYEVIAKIPTSITISYVGNREFGGYLRRQDTGTYLAYKPVKLTVRYLSGATWQTATYNLQTRHDGYWTLEFLFYWNTATISFEGDETYASSSATITR